MFFPNLVLESELVFGLRQDTASFSSKNQQNHDFSEKSNFFLNICIFFDWFLLILVKNDLKWNFQWKKVKMSNFKFFRFFRKVVILLVLRWESSCILTQKWPISTPRPDLESSLNSIMRSITKRYNLIGSFSGLRWPRSRLNVKNLQLGSNVSFVENQILRSLWPNMV
jgi:hypothetical protein